MDGPDGEIFKSMLDPILMMNVDSAFRFTIAKEDHDKFKNIHPLFKHIRCSPHDIIKKFLFLEPPLLMKERKYGSDEDSKFDMMGNLVNLGFGIVDNIKDPEFNVSIWAENLVSANLNIESKGLGDFLHHAACLNPVYQSTFGVMSEFADDEDRAAIEKAENDRDGGGSDNDAPEKKALNDSDDFSY